MSLKVTLLIASLTRVRLVTSDQPCLHTISEVVRQLIGIGQWYRSALCGHPLPTLTDNWTCGAAKRHTATPISLHLQPTICELVLIFSALVASGCLQWTRCESNSRGYESDTLPLDQLHHAPACRRRHETW